jgi:hypothetical protein
MADVIPEGNAFQLVGVAELTVLKLLFWMTFHELTNVVLVILSDSL